jgi:hypothetical protein
MKSEKQSELKESSCTYVQYFRASRSPFDTMPNSIDELLFHSPFNVYRSSWYF